MRSGYLLGQPSSRSTSVLQAAIASPRNRDCGPTVVASGPRSVVVYAIEPDDGPVTVTVASEAGWHLVGVVGGVDVATVADTVAERGLDAALRPIAAGAGRVGLSWKGA